MKKKIYIMSFITLFSFFTHYKLAADSLPFIGNIYCTAVDHSYFPRVVNLIGSIHAVDFDNVHEIAVFDLGMQQDELNFLSKIQKVKIYQVEKKHPDILVPFVTRSDGRKVRGWFAWKPVVIKQALDIFPYVLYLDAGTTVLQPLTNLFRHIHQNGSFLINTGHNIEERITQSVINKIVSPMSLEQQTMILDKNTMEIDAGFQGLSRALYVDYVMPMYNLAADLSLFMDDGSARLGFGAGRHDQILFSIFANTLQLQFHNHGLINLTANNQSVPFNIHCDPAHISAATHVYRSREHTKLPHYKKLIRYTA